MNKIFEGKCPSCGHGIIIKLTNSLHSYSIDDVHASRSSLRKKISELPDGPTKDAVMDNLDVLIQGVLDDNDVDIVMHGIEGEINNNKEEKEDDNKKPTT